MMFSLKSYCFKRQAQKQLRWHHLCQNNAENTVIRCPAKLNCFLLVCVAEHISQLHFQKCFLHVYSKNYPQIYLALTLSEKKKTQLFLGRRCIH